MKAPKTPRLSPDANRLVLDMTPLIQPTIHELFGRVTRSKIIELCTDKVMQYAFQRMAEEIGLTDIDPDGMNPFYSNQTDSED